MTLDVRGGVRPFVIASIVAMGVVVAGCPSSQNPGQSGDAGTADGMTDGGTGTPACANPQPSCTATIKTHVSGTTVELRGDFAADGWTTGIPMTASAGGGFEATIPVGDEQIVSYKLVVDGTWIADPDNPRKSPDGFGDFNSVIRVDCDHCAHRKAIDWRDAILYFIMIDRFDDGDASNNATVDGAELPGQYQGGDFAGIQHEIDSGYFDQLGINTIWITSPLDNTHASELGSDGHRYSGYHGYWPKDETLIDSHYGSEAELKAMIDHAHQHGIQILIDYVMNHVTLDSPIYQQNPGWFWPNDNGQGGNCVCGQGCPVFNTVCWFDTFLPTFNMLNGDARRWSIENAIMWAKKLGIDGFRLDAVKQVEGVWFTDLRARVQGEVAWDQKFYMVGETFDGNRDLIKSYVNPDTMLDGQFDFPLRGAVLATLLHRNGSISDLSGFVASNDTFYGPGAVMSTFLDNHDVPRAIEHALDTPMFDPWDGGKSGAWTGQATLPTSASPFERLFVAYAFLFTSPGIPMLYYGDEVGMPGAGDPDNRRFMQWDGYTQNQLTLRDRLGSLAKARTAHEALRRGTRTTLGTTNDAWVYKMESSSDTVFVALNRGDASQPAQGLPAGSYKDLVTGQTITGAVTLAPRSALVLIPN